MKILGLDPGIAIVGWATVVTSSYQPKLLEYGTVRTAKDLSTQHRLQEIHLQLSKLIERIKPDIVSIEEVYFSSNVKTAMTVGEARGAILLTAALANIPVVSYSPLTIKQAITGDGKADKKQIQQMVKSLFKLKEIPRPDDAADACSIALTHAYSHRFLKHL